MANDNDGPDISDFVRDSTPALDHDETGEEYEDPYPFAETRDPNSLFRPAASKVTPRPPHWDGVANGRDCVPLFSCESAHDKAPQPCWKLVMFDAADGRFTVVRGRRSQLEASQFASLIGICGIHPNALPRNVH